MLDNLFQDGLGCSFCRLEDVFHIAGDTQPGETRAKQNREPKTKAPSFLLSKTSLRIGCTS